jgi:rubrerythrin
MAATVTPPGAGSPPPNAAGPMPRMPLDAAFNQAFRPGGDSRPTKDYARDLGEGVMEAILSGVAEQVKRQYAGLGGASAGDGNLFTQLAAMGQAVKSIREAFGLSGEGEGAGTNGGDKGIWMFLAKQAEVQGQILQELLKSRTAAAPDPQEIAAKAQEQLLKTVEVVKGLVAQGNSADDILRALGQNVLQGALNRPDPLDEALEKIEKLRRLEGDRGDNVIDLEWWKAKQEVEIERERLRQEREREREQQQARNQLLAGFFESVRDRPAASRPPTAPTPAPIPGSASAGGLHRYHCGACGNVFAMTELLPEVVCPRCRTPLRAQVPGSPPTPPAPAPRPPADGATAPAPEAPPPPSSDVTGLDALWGEADVLS